MAAFWSSGSMSPGSSRSSHLAAASTLSVIHLVMAAPISWILAIMRPPISSKNFHKPLKALRQCAIAPSQSPVNRATTPLTSPTQNVHNASMYSRTGSKKVLLALLRSQFQASPRALLI